MCCQELMMKRNWGQKGKSGEGGEWRRPRFGFRLCSRSMGYESTITSCRRRMVKKTRRGGRGRMVPD